MKHFWIPYLMALAMVALTQGDLVSDQFEKRLYQALIKRYNHTMFVSPRAIRISLGLVYLASELRTALELGRSLDMPIDKKQVVMDSFKEMNTDFRHLPVKFITRLYLAKRYTLLERFNELAMKYLQAGAENVDFERKSEIDINNWMARESGNKLKSVLMPGQLAGRMILVSAVYFHCELDNLQTTKAIFYDDSPHPTIMMHGIGRFKFNEMKGLAQGAVEIPLGMKYNHSLLLILPYAGESVLSVEKKLSDRHIAKITATFLKESWVNVTLPQYVGTIDLTLSKELHQLGISRIQRHEGYFGALVKRGFCPHLTEFISQTRLTITNRPSNPANPSLPKATKDLKQIIFDRPFLYMVKNNEIVYFKGFITWLPNVEPTKKVVVG